MESLDQPTNPNVDELDLSIINLMKVNGRISYKDVSTRMAIPEATARYRVQRLLSSGMINVETWANPKYLGPVQAAIMHLFVENGQVNYVAAQLAQMEEVQFLSIVTGGYNIVVNVTFDAQEDLLRFFDKLTAIKGMIRYETQIVKRLLKSRYAYDFN
ncbi:MAG: Lrp/AsnC family transcriptional regulator [Nodosilinea sp. LVE1205-7]|jgi:Lrp/AsnC family transcriptional regulator for asnA, asnC and gidA